MSDSHADGDHTPPMTGPALKRTFPEYDGQLAHHETVPEASADYVPPATVLEEDLAASFTETVGELYSHQASALAALEDGENVCVATSTSSGKTYVYALQIARLHRAAPSSTALIVYPMKALARDQQQQLNDFYDDLGLDIQVEVYDGDTPQHRRQMIRNEADVIITNFAGVNTYLESHPLWRSFYSGCRLLVIDESHTYTGVHGMHVAWTIRRLRRVLDYYGSDPQVVATSATIGNPIEHCEQLTGKSFTVVDDDGSPRGEREMVFWQPPLDEGSLAPDASYEEFQDAQTSPVREASSLLAHLGKHGLQTLLFVRSRKNAELAAKYVGQAASDHPRPGYVSVEPYHAGLGKEARRGTEYEFKTNQLDGVTSTSALELGIDIGSMDATILTGYPGTRQSFWQQVGRSGRGTADALSVFVARADAIDQYITENPEYVLGDAIEDAVVNLQNNPVYARHLRCAADELPLTAEDREWFDGDRLADAVAMWRDAGELAGDLDRGVRYTGDPRPQSDISMYATSGVQYQVHCANGEISMEPIEKDRAYRDFHPGALFLHDGVQYEVVDLQEDRPQPRVVVEQVRTNEYTQTSYDKSVRELAPEARVDLGDDFWLAWGSATVEIHYNQYQRRSISSGSATQPMLPTGLDPIELRTHVMWLELPAAFESTIVEAVADDPGELSQSDATELFTGGLHGAEHAMIKMTPLELRINKSDLGGLSTPNHSDTGVPTWFIHDTVEGGLGFSKRIFERAGSIAERARDRVASCDCQGTGGCPACIMDADCGNMNRLLHTRATVDVLDRVLHRLDYSG